MRPSGILKTPSPGTLLNELTFSDDSRTSLDASLLEDKKPVESKKLLDDKPKKPEPADQSKARKKLDSILKEEPAKKPEPERKRPELKKQDSVKRIDREKVEKVEEVKIPEVKVEEKSKVRFHFLLSNNVLKEIFDITDSSSYYN